MQREVIRTADAPGAIGPYSQAIAVRGGRTVYTSGQIPLDPVTLQIVGDGDIVAQTERVLDNLQGVLAAAGVGFEHVVKAGIFLADMGHFTKVNDLYARRFSKDPPARSTVQVAYLPRGVLIEIDMIAVGP
ncbi:MAG: RidA family protein [Nannocystis sp.]|nr:RidA family protein [Nannocystis sp.]MBA3550394.1 RidA family protein [Nannocystis sp.]